MNLIPPLIDSIQACQTQCLTDIYGGFVKSLWSKKKKNQNQFFFIFNSYMYKHGRLTRVITEGQSAVCCALWKYTLVNNQIPAAVQHHTCCPGGVDDKHDMTDEDWGTEG